MKNFQFIKDTRFSHNPMGDIIKMTHQLEKDIFDVAILIISPIREIKFENCVSYRRKFTVKKRIGQTWNDVYSVINKIQAPKFENGG